MKKHLIVIAADSGAALLNERFEPLQVVAACATLVERPYIKASTCLAEPIFRQVEDGHELVIHELELCLSLLKTVKADVVHLDMSLGSASVDELSAIGLSQLHVSGRARGHLLRILPKLRRIALEIKQAHKINVLAIGKESVPVRIAELTAGAYAVLYSAEKTATETKPLHLGLPARCTTRIEDDGIVLSSLLPAEQDLSGYARDEKRAIERVQIVEMPNPCARGFRVLEISPRT